MISLSLHQLLAHKISLLRFRFELRIQYIGEKEKFQDKKHDKQLDADNQPERFAQLHAFETIDIKAINRVEQMLHKNLLLADDIRRINGSNDKQSPAFCVLFWQIVVSIKIRSF